LCRSAALFVGWFLSFLAIVFVRAVAVRQVPAVPALPLVLSDGEEACCLTVSSAVFHCV